ncbi:hypothetical protein CTI12_AA010980 [Artemisia annua]|uniref:Zinc knuckle CX2CX4HX4C n=1 Tax=Artemisia annua TaxID=35608 RepID=A0A2U1QMD5_ARTAN|nr:hypothetical protein CTI12_AA010980 [Artemisia annua]
MSEINPHPPNPDPINPNSIPPPVASDVWGSKSSLGVKKGSKKGSGKNRNMAKGMEGVEYDGNDTEDMEVKDDEHVVSMEESEVAMVSSSQGLTENDVNKDVSFASAFKGLTGYGNNKLTKVPVRINEQGREVVDMDPVIEEDRITTSMCERAYGRASFARVLIEVEASTELVENIEVCYEKMGKSMNLKVEYAWKPPLCTQCKVFGHELRTCRLKVVTVDEEKEKEMIKNVGVSTVNAVKVDGSSKSGEEWLEDRRVNKNGGRGGMQGRNGVFQRGGNESYNVKYVPVENGGRKIDDGLVMEGKTKENILNKGKGISGVNDIVGKAKTKNVTSVKNTFEDKGILERFSGSHHASSLQFIKSIKIEGTIFQRFSADLLAKLSTDLLVMHHHKQSTALICLLVILYYAGLM